MLFKLKNVVLGLGLTASCMGALASPCDNTHIDIVNQTSKDMILMTSEGYLETSISNISVGDILPAHGERTVSVSSGIGTLGDAKGLLVFRNRETSDKHRFVSLSFDFENKYWLACNKNLEVLNTLSDEFKVYKLPGFRSNVKAYIVE